MQISNERIGALFFLVLSVLYGYYGSEIRLYPGDEFEPMTARTLPYVLSLLGVVFSIILLITGRPKPEESGPKESRRWAPVLFLIGLTLFYGLTLDWLGFVISTILFLIGGFRILGETRWRTILLVSIPFVLIFWFCLTQLLDIYLAPGRLFSGLIGV